ncbi:MAG TPA: PIN domain-containing protein [Acidimicrobiales bacterium]|nr:PIN domain-containing protein [Acidimicrobiales bacterium]
MSRLLLDTTFLIDAERSQLNLDDVIDDEDDVAISAITVAEIQVGVELATGKTRHRRMELLNDVVALIPILDYDLAVARAHAQLLVMVRRQGRPRGAHDLIIAATALSSSRSLVTADEMAFVDLGIATISYR